MKALGILERFLICALLSEYLASLTKSIALEMLLSDKPELSEKRVERMPNSRAFSFIFWMNCKRLMPAERESA